MSTKQHLIRSLLFGIVFFLLCSREARADHILGGNIEMLALDAVPGRYLLRLVVFQNEEEGVSGHVPDTQGVMIFRTRDNRKMQFVELKLANSGKTDVVYFNDSCSSGRRLKTGKLILEKEINLDPQEYDDPQGYYVVWSSCCRDATIANILRPVKTGIIFQLKFPPLLREGQPFLNSSPAFSEINGEYLCVNSPFMLNFDATDKDGDELRYSVVTPLDSYTQSNNLTESQYQGMTDYPLVKWVRGHGTANVMNGDPDLAVDERTGILTVTPTQLGLFVFTIQVDEYRHGEWIGSTRRDYQFLVIDCPATIPPTPQVRIKGFPGGASSGVICKGSSVTLEADNAPGRLYQWRKDGRFISNARTPRLEVRESGTYSVDIAFKNICGRSAKSREIKITVVGSEARIDAESRTVCEGKPTELFTEPAPGLVYSWYRNGNLIPGAHSPRLPVKTEGHYSVHIEDPGSGCPASESPALEITALPVSPVTITAAPAIACEGDPVTLSVPNASGNTYQWLYNGSIIPAATSRDFAIREEGRFTVRITDERGCRNTSLPFNMKFRRQVMPTLTPLPEFCPDDATPYLLEGNPAGGIFSGSGVTGAYFTPATAGAGVHEITYTVNGALHCDRGEARRPVRVDQPPQPELPAVVTTRTGIAVTLYGDVGDAYRYQWAPVRGLSRPDIPEPEANPEETTTYLLTITDEKGCVSRAQTEVAVEPRITIPSAFSPNNDGVNDVWALQGGNEIPNLEVFIYNRWGKLVFHSLGYRVPWDGTDNGSPVPPGHYSYHIRLAGTVYTGSVAVLF